jgi:hypothetical protein
MKKVIFYFFLSIATMQMFQNCSKDPEVNTGLSDQGNSFDVAKSDAITEEFSKIISLALKDRDFRLFLKSEAEFQFDGEYDVPLSFVLDKQFKAGVTVTTLLEESDPTNTLKLGKSESMADFIKKNVPNIQVSIPVNIDKWNAENDIPFVICRPIQMSKTATELKAIKADGSVKMFSTKTKPDEPIIVVRLSERVDRNLNLSVTKDGLCIGKMSRKPAISAYNNRSSLKSTGKYQSKFIKIVDNLEPAKKQTIDMGIKSSTNSSIKVSNLKSSTTMAVPVPKIPYPSQDKKIEIDWNAVDGTTYYLLYRKLPSDADYKVYKTVTPNYYIDQNLTPGLDYYYKVRSVKVVGESSEVSGFSDPVAATASLRTADCQEKIKYFYIDKGYASDLEGWFDDDPEINIILASASTSTGGATATQIVDAQYLENDNQGRWNYYDWSTFSWSGYASSPIYTLRLMEDDGDGSSVKITIGCKVPLKYITGSEVNVSAEFTIKSNDDNMGEFYVRFWDLPQSYDVIGTNGKCQLYIGWISKYNKCPYIGSYDGAHCYVGTPPAGTHPFIYNDGLYYSQVNGTCPAPGSYAEGGSCKWLVPDKFTSAFIYNGSFYVQPEY